MMVPRQPGTLGGVWPFSGGVSRGTHTLVRRTRTRTHAHAHTHTSHVFKVKQTDKRCLASKLLFVHWYCKHKHTHRRPPHQKRW